MQKRSGAGIDEVSIISNGVIIEGILKSNGNVRIDGIIKGDVDVAGNLTLGESAEVNGEVKAENITLSGKVTGSLKANEKIVLEAKCMLNGDLFAKILVVEPGAKFDGKCNMVSVKENKIEPKKEPQQIK